MSVKGRAGAVEVARDEQPFTADPAKIPKLKPAFREGGTVTAANSSSISDGAAALVLMRMSEARRRKLEPLAKVVGMAGVAQAPAWFTTAPIFAIRKLLDAVGWSAREVGLYEINEAFAVVAMAAMRDLALPHEKVNVHGGACALGHPIGASGARIIVTLLAAMEKYGERQGRGSAVHRRRRGDGSRRRTRGMRTIHTEIGIVGAGRRGCGTSSSATGQWAEWNPFARVERALCRRRTSGRGDRAARQEAHEVHARRWSSSSPAGS